MVANTVAVDQALWGHRLDHDEGKHGDQDHHDEERPDHRGRGAEFSELVTREMGEAAPVTARGAEEYEHVLHAACEHGPDQQPERSGQVAELGRKRRSNEGSRACDRRKMVAEHDRAVRRHEVTAVVETLGGCRPRRIQPADTRGYPAAVEAIADQVSADRRDHEPECIDALAVIQRNAAQGGRARDGDRAPQGDTGELGGRHQGMPPAARATIIAAPKPGQVRVRIAGGGPDPARRAPGSGGWPAGRRPRA
jgi:hypothetical protein